MPSSSKAKARVQKPVKEASAKQASSKKASNKQTSSKKAPVNNATAKKAPAKKAPAKNATVKSATVKSATVKSATVKSATVKSATAKSATAKSATVKSATVKSATVKSATAKSATAKSATAKSATAKKAPAKQPRPARQAPAKKAVSKAPAPSARKAAGKKAAGKSASKSRKAASAALVVKAEPTPSRVARQALSQKRAIAAALGPAVDGKQIVDAYMRDVDHPFKQEMQAVREIILAASPKISERIKWNAPSFYYKEDLGAFNPRATEYAHLILLFPDGQGMQDASGLLEGNHKDRREAKFYGMDDVSKKKPALEKLVKSWVALRG